MALIKGKFIDPAIVIKQSQDPVSGDDLARKSYVDTKSEGDAAAAQSAAELYAAGAASAAQSAAEGYADGKVEDQIVDGVTTKAPSQNAVADALALKQNSIGSGTLLQFLRGDLTWQEISVPDEVIYADNLGALPIPGDATSIYGTKDNNKLWRWGSTGQPLVPNWTVGATGDFATLEAALASPSVVNGHVIAVQAGTYSVSSTLVISKEVKIVGAGIGQTIFQTAGLSSDPVSMISVTANNVLLKGMTIKHRKSSNTSVEAAITVSAGAWPTFTYVSGFIMDSCRVEYAEFGMVIRGDGFKLSNNQFAYATGSVSNSNRCIGLYGQRGECFIVSNVFDNSSLASTAFRPIYSTSTNASSNETLSGKLVIQSNTHLGLLQQFYNQDNIRGTNGDFALYIKSNITNETSLFAGLYVTATNQLDLFSQVVLEGNTISNNHEATTGLGKGLLAIDGAGTAIVPRSAALPVHASGNVLGQLAFRADFAEATGSSGSIVGYKPSVFASMTVTQDTSIPAYPVAPATPGDAVAAYVEMSPALIDDAIVDGVIDRAPSQNAVADALAGKAALVHTHTSSSITDFASAAKSAAVSDAIVDGVLDVAPSQNAVHDALALKASASALSQEILDRQGADSALQSAVDGKLDLSGGTMSGAIAMGAQKITGLADGVDPQDAVTKSQLDAAVAAADQAPYKQSRVLDSTDIANGYVDLTRVAMPNSMMVSVSGTVQYEGEDYSLSTVGGVTRVTFLGDLTPDGDGAALVVGDKVHFHYWASVEV